MSDRIESATLNQWYVIETQADLREDRPRRTRLLGADIIAKRNREGQVSVDELDSEGKILHALPVLEQYGYVFTSLGEPDAIFAVPEFDEANRRLVTCGAIQVNTSPGRIIENFLDMSHFPFVHPGVLGAEPLTEVEPYKMHVNEETGELWATDCGFNQPQAMASSDGSADVEYLYRVPQPFSAVLYKTCPEQADAFDLVGIFPQPLKETLCDVHCFMLVIDSASSHEGMLQWQQGIFMQDRIILENQRPARLPLAPRMEKPNQADVASVHYRKWLRGQGVQYGTV